MVDRREGMKKRLGTTFSVAIFLMVVWLVNNGLPRWVTVALFVVVIILVIVGVIKRRAKGNSRE